MLIVQWVFRRTRQLVQWQMYRDGRALALRPRERLDTPAVRTNHAVTDGQAESAAMGSLVAAATGEEHVKYFLALCFRNTGPLICHSNEQLVLFTACGDTYLPILGRKMGGVLNHVN